MYTSGSIFDIVFFLVIVSFILYGLLLIVEISSVKVMLFGIALIVFSNSVLKGLTYGIDGVISAIGFSFCIVGFIKKDNIN